MPLPRAPVLSTNVVPAEVISEYEPVYAIFRIVEVSEVNGVQRYFIARIGMDRTGIQVGVIGEMAEDERFQRVIGNYRITEMFSDFFRGEIVELTYRIGSTAFVRVQTGERLRQTNPGS
jgi:hypothetical protein